MAMKMAYKLGLQTTYWDDPPRMAIPPKYKALLKGYIDII